MLKLDDGRKALYQWDVGVTASVLDNQITQVHFSNLSYGISYAVEVEGGKVLIPPEVLQNGADVYCWAYVSTDDKSYTKKDIVFNVIKRPKPTGYIYTPTDIETLESIKAELLGELNSKLDVSKVVGYDPEFAFSADTVFSTEAIFEIVAYIDFFLKGLAEEKENKSNKAIEINENSTNEQYASAKSVYDYIQSVLPPSAEEVEY